MLFRSQMLPIFKNKEQSATGIIMKNRKPDNSEEKQDDSDLESCGREIIQALKADDAKAIAKAIKKLANIADEEPHEEGEHVSPHSYDAQNEQAASNQKD